MTVGDTVIAPAGHTAACNCGCRRAAREHARGTVIEVTEPAGERWIVVEYENVDFDGSPLTVAYQEPRP